MSLYKPKRSPFWNYDFVIQGRRFFGSTETASRREAQAIEAAERKKALVEVAAASKNAAQIKGKAPLTLDVAAGRWWHEVGQHRADADDCWTATEAMLDHFGHSKRMDQITDADVAQWVAGRRADHVWGKTKLKSGEPAPVLSPSSVNRSTVDCLRRIFGRARKAWKLVFANEPDWAEHRLAEPEERVRELGADEQAAIEVAAHPDYLRVYRFARLSGLRMANCLIPKAAVKWDLGRIEIRGKGGKLNRVPLSQPLRELLAECWDDHPEMVFTYAAARPSQAREVARGERVPITVNGLKSQWKRDRARAAVTCPTIVTFRFHDNRHTAATRILRASKNLKVAQILLNHSRITTTAKYAHVLEDEVLAAMNGTPDGDRNSRTESRTAAPDDAKPVKRIAK